MLFARVTFSLVIYIASGVIVTPSTVTAFLFSLPSFQRQSFQPNPNNNGNTIDTAVAVPPWNTAKRSRKCITEWVVQGLESGNSTVTSTSAIIAGENDTLPEFGIPIAKVRVLASGSKYSDKDGLVPIRLLVGRNGWGTGVHPTTRLCLEWICEIVQGGETVLDYGCGSGILSIAALHMGAGRCVGVDVEAEALVTAVRNLELNGYVEGNGRFDAMHTREVLPYGISTTGVDICVANILVGQLVRSSMVVAIVTNLAPGGLLCLSGIRPGDQVESLKLAYGNYIDWIDNQYSVLSASNTKGSIESYGFDCGEWSRLVGRKKEPSTRDDIDAMSEYAVS